MVAKTTLRTKSSTEATIKSMKLLTTCLSIPWTSQKMAVLILKLWATMAIVEVLLSFMMMRNINI